MAQAVIFNLRKTVPRKIKVFYSSLLQQLIDFGLLYSIQHVHDCASVHKSFSRIDQGEMEFRNHFDGCLNWSPFEKETQVTRSFIVKELQLSKFATHLLFQKRI